MALNDMKVQLWKAHKMLEDMNVIMVSGPDGISNRVLKDCKDQLVSKIHRVIECSLREGKVYWEWKMADVVPVFIGGKKEKHSSYRPVSHTSVVAQL